jgi:[histone H3]-trimethyl-L-lysine4 demethylase
MVSTPNVGPSPAGGMSSYTTTLNMRQSSTNGTTSATTKAGRTSIVLPPTIAPTPIPEKVALPLSARQAESLDLNTVERRGHPTESKETDSKPSRPHGLQEAPTFRPTEEEFKNPMEYIRKIAPEGRKYGIAKIIPPDGWNPDFAIDTKVNFLMPSYACALSLL